MLIKNIMTKKVVAASRNDSLADVIKKFINYNISGVPVVESRKVIGIVTETEVINAVNAFGPKIHYDTASSFSIILSVLRGRDIESIKKNFKKIKVRDIMNKKVVCIDADKRVIDAARIMSRTGYNRLPVIKSGKLVGIIARGDIVRAMGK